MAETFIPLFSSTVRSSLWSLSGDCLKVFLTLALEAGPDGVVVASIDGLRRITDIPIDELRKHLDTLESPDPYSKDLSRAPEREGRRLERLHNGWRVVNQEWYREEARRQAELFRKRKWWNEKGAAARRDARPTEKETYPERETQTQTDTETLRLAKGLASSSDPAQSLETTLAPGKDLPESATGIPTVIREIPDGFSLPEDIRQDARILGLSDTEIDHYWGELCKGPIGGTRGILQKRFAKYLKDLPKQWRVWAEVARSSNTIGRSGAFKARTGPDPSGSRPASGWSPDQRHRAFADKHGLTLDDEAREYRRSLPDGPTLDGPVLDKGFGEFMVGKVKKRRKVAG